MRCYWETLNKHLDKTHERSWYHGHDLMGYTFPVMDMNSPFVPERLKCNFHFTFFAHALLDNVMFSMIYGKAQKVPLPMQARFSSTNSSKLLSIFLSTENDPKQKLFCVLLLFRILFEEFLLFSLSQLIVMLWFDGLFCDHGLLLTFFCNSWWMWVISL